MIRFEIKISTDIYKQTKFHLKASKILSFNFNFIKLTSEIIFRKVFFFKLFFKTAFNLLKNLCLFSCGKDLHVNG